MPHGGDQTANRPPSSSKQANLPFAGEGKNAKHTKHVAKAALHNLVTQSYLSMNRYLQHGMALRISAQSPYHMWSVHASATRHAIRTSLALLTPLPGTEIAGLAAEGSDKTLLGWLEGG